MSSSTPPYIPQIRLYQNWLREQRGLEFASYDALWRWSTTDLNAFWQSIWDYFDLRSPTPHTAALVRNAMPGAQWFSGAKVNYAQQVFRHVQAADAAGMPAIICRNEAGHTHQLSWAQLRQQVAALALYLQAQGVKPGDRVAAYLPNIAETMVAFLATTSIGAVWSVCAPDMGTQAVLDRLQQIEPVVLIAVDGVRYGGREIDRRPVLAELCAGLPTVRHLIVHQSLGLPLDASKTIANYAMLQGICERNDAQVAAFEPVWLPFDHPLWIVYSSGTTGLPKPIVHGQGGTIIVALALKILHNDVGCSYAPNSWGERYHWYSSTGWVMWNAQTSGLLNGTTCVIYDGNPGGSKEKPDWGVLWRFAADLGVTFFGAGAAYFANCMKSGLDLASIPGLERIRALGTTGSPLSEDVQRWGTQQFERVRAQQALGGVAMGESGGSQGLSGDGPPRAASAPSGGREPHAVGESGGRQAFSGNKPHSVAGSVLEGQPPVGVGSVGANLSGDGPPRAASAPSGGSVLHEVKSVEADIWWCNISGGTDFAGAFIGGNRELPQVPGQMQCRLLGCAVEAWNEQGEPVIDEVGELVCSQPIPSMPLYFWGDKDNQRYLSSYFDMYPPGHGRNGGEGPVWRHGDWLKITPTGACIIYGRSDATINRYGLRMGTSELYSAVEALPEVLDSMVVDLEYLGRESYMPLFVVLREGAVLNEAMRERINNAIRQALSPRFVPNDIFLVPEIPRTLSGKKQELPIKKLLLGQPIEKVINKEAMANPGCLDWYVQLAASRANHN